MLFLKQANAVILAVLMLSCSGCGGGGSEEDNKYNSPTLESVFSLTQSSIATYWSKPLFIFYDFTDRDGNLDGGTFSMDWGGWFTQNIQLDESFAGLMSGSGNVKFPLFLTPPTVGEITINCWLTDNEGNKSNENSFLITLTEPSWPWQLGADGDDIGKGIAIGRDDRIYLLGNNSKSGIGYYGRFIAQYSPDAFCLGVSLIDIHREKDIIIDANNDIYISGEISAYKDVSVFKYDISGNKIWEASLSSSETDIAGGIAVDGDGNVYVTGSTTGVIGDNLDIVINPKYDMLLAKYNSSGNKEWTIQFGSNCNVHGANVAIDSKNNIYVVGYADNDIDGQDYIRSNSTLLVKFDSMGNRLWARLLGCASYFDTPSLAIDSLNNIYVAGRKCGFISMFDSSGNEKWMKRIGGESWNTSLYDIAVDYNNDIVVTGAIYGDNDSDIPTSGFDVLLAKYDSSGTQLWLTLFSTPDRDYGHALAIDSNNNIYITGQTEGSFPGYINAGNDDLFISKFDSDGFLQE